MAFECPGCREDLNVDSSQGWPYIRSAVILHFDVCAVYHCGSEQRARCAEAIADLVAPITGLEEVPRFRCPFEKCGAQD